MALVYVAHAVTRNRREASGPASAAPAESANPNELGGLIMEQPNENATEISDVVPSPELQDSLPPGQTSWLLLRVCYCLCMLMTSHP